MTEIWAYRVDMQIPTAEIVGFDVEANDGHIGKVDEASHDVGAAHLVVDTGFWIFGKKRIIPARAIKQINAETETVFVDMTKDEVKGAPDHHDDWFEPEHRPSYDAYYEPFPW
ncbi:MAG: PRC-barrel domain-containing protein [Acidimicrobiia bacterium]